MLVLRVPYFYKKSVKPIHQTAVLWFISSSIIFQFTKQPFSVHFKTNWLLKAPVDDANYMVETLRRCPIRPRLIFTKRYCYTHQNTSYTSYIHLKILLYSSKHTWIRVVAKRFEESCKEVQAVISFLKPQVVFLELCSSRVSILTIRELKVPTFSEMIDMWKKKHNVFGILYGWFLAKVAEKLEVFPGSEFRVAFEEAMKCSSKVILGDRPVNITLMRTWIKMPLWHRTKLIYSLLFQAVFLPNPEDLEKMLKEMNDVDMLTLVIQEMSKEFPTLMETLVNERDQYMSSRLFQIAREHTSVVAIVGKGHLRGIKRNWNQPIQVNELLEIPSTRPVLSVVKVLSTLGIAVAGVAIVYGILFASKKQS